MDLTQTNHGHSWATCFPFTHWGLFSHRKIFFFFLGGFDNLVAACLRCLLETFSFVLPRSSRCSTLCGCIYPRKVCLGFQLLWRETINVPRKRFWKASAFKMVHVFPFPSIDKPKALSLLLHTADISHPAKNWDLHHHWTTSLLEEFFRQVRRWTRQVKEQLARLNMELTRIQMWEKAALSPGHVEFQNTAN